MKTVENRLLCLNRKTCIYVMETNIMKRALNVLLVTALVAPLLLLTGCTNCCNDKCETTYDKCGTEYTSKDGK